MSGDASDETLNELIAELEKFIQNGCICEAQFGIKNHKYEQCFQDRSWDIIPVIIKYLLQENINNAELLNRCDIALEHIAEVANPDEAFLELLQQTDSLDNDTKFLTLLKPLRIVLDNLPKRREHSLEWCLSAIHSHVTALPVPQNHKLEDEERKLLDADPSVVRIASVYTGVIPFVRYFALETISHQCKPSEGENICSQHAIMTYSVLRLLGRPLVYLDLENEEKANSTVRVLAEELMLLLAQLVNDVISFLEDCHPGVQSLNWFNREENVSVLSVANFYYLLFAEKLQLGKAPCVYSPLYIFQKCLCLVVVLMEHEEIFMTSKALLLTDALLSRVKEGEVPYFLLDSPAHSKFVQCLMRVMIYCEIERQRKQAVKIFRNYLFKFDTKGRYLLMLNIQKIANHSGIIGYLIMQLKDMVEANLKSSPTASKYFRGKCLTDLLIKYCALSHGAETDLVENIDQIVSALNLIRYLLLRDKKNETGVWNCIDGLQTRFLEPLREGITLSRAHYQLKAKDIEEEKKVAKDSKVEAESQVTITVGGQQLPVTQEHKINVINSALNAFDLMESLLGRVNECIEDTNVNE